MKGPNRRVSVADVFQPTPLQGNSLAVFFDTRGLTDSQMHAIAREMNLSETTTIIFPRETERDRGVHVGIFTTEEELPFAGHSLEVARADHNRRIDLQRASEYIEKKRQQLLLLRYERNG
jgi:PhzF family phenazine biosynthesis protein